MAFLNQKWSLKCAKIVNIEFVFKIHSKNASVSVINEWYKQIESQVPDEVAFVTENSRVHHFPFEIEWIYTILSTKRINYKFKLK